MSCIIRAGVCYIQVSYCIATVFVVGSCIVFVWRACQYLIWFTGL